LIPVLNYRLSVPKRDGGKRCLSSWLGLKEWNILPLSLLCTERREFKTGIRYYMPEYIIWEQNKVCTLANSFLELEERGLGIIHLTMFSRFGYCTL
jgi:hypothetical protein